MTAVVESKVGQTMCLPRSLIDERGVGMALFDALARICAASGVTARWEIEPANASAGVLAQPWRRYPPEHRRALE